MNKHIKKQLDKVKQVNLGYYDDNTTHIYIPKVTSIKLELNESYLIRLFATILHPQENSILVSN